MDTRPDIEIVEPRAAGTVDDRLERAARIRERSKELVDALGPDHPLVAAALERARALELEADGDLWLG